MNDIKNKLTHVMKSCSENSPSVAASMVKFHNNKMVSYGGVFCVQVPFQNGLDCAFSPKPLLNFFRKPREGVVYTHKNGKMLVKHKRERVTITTVEGTAMPIIDVLSEPEKVKKFPSKKAIKCLLECINPSDPLHALQGVLLKDRMAVATNRKVILALPSGLSKNIDLVLPIDTLKFMSTLDAKVNRVAYDGTHIKFYYDDGMTVCSQIIDSEKFPTFQGVVVTKGDEVKINEQVVEELSGIKCDTVTVSNEGITYTLDEGKSVGELRIKSRGEFSFTVRKPLFDILMDLTIDNIIYIDKGMKSLHANGQKHFRMVLTTYANA